MQTTVKFISKEIREALLIAEKRLATGIIRLIDCNHKCIIVHDLDCEVMVWLVKERSFRLVERGRLFDKEICSSLLMKALREET